MSAYEILTIVSVFAAFFCTIYALIFSPWNNPWAYTVFLTAFANWMLELGAA